MEKENKENNNNECKYYLRERKLIKYSKLLGIKRKEEYEKKKNKKKEKKNKDYRNYKRYKLGLSKIDLNSKIIHKYELAKLIFRLIKNVNSKKNKINDDEDYFSKINEKQYFLKLLREKIINLSLEQIKEISQKFFLKNNKNIDNEIYLELNKLDKANFDSLFSYINELEKKNLLNKEFISYNDELKKHNIQEKKINLNKYESIFSKENLLNFSKDSSSEESDSISNE